MLLLQLLTLGNAAILLRSHAFRKQLSSVTTTFLYYLSLTSAEAFHYNLNLMRGKKKDGCSVRSRQHGRVIILYSFTETRAKAVLKVEILSQHNWVCRQRGYLIMVKIILLHAQQIAFSWVWVFCGIENKMFVYLFFES